MPMDLGIITPSDEPMRLFSAVAEELDYRRLTATYSRLGRIEYSPRLLFKVILYGCTRGIYATREIERACRENVNFMYLLEASGTGITASRVVTVQRRKKLRKGLYARKQAMSNGSQIARFYSETE